MEGFMEVELMVTKRDDDNRRPTDRQGEYRAICLWKMDWQSFAIYKFPSTLQDHKAPNLGATRSLDGA